MKTKLLLPAAYKSIGWIIFIPATVLGILFGFFDFEVYILKTKVFALVSDEVFSNYETFGFVETDITNTLLALFFIIGAMMVGFSREKYEDEFIAELRLSSLLWAVWLNYALLVASLIFVWGTTFLSVMVYNMFTVLIIFIVRFNYLLYRNKRAARHEE